MLRAALLLALPLTLMGVATPAPPAAETPTASKSLVASPASTSTQAPDTSPSLKKKASISGKVTPPEKFDVKKIVVFARGPHGQMTGPIVDGAFKIDNLDAGEYAVGIDDHQLGKFYCGFPESVKLANEEEKADIAIEIKEGELLQVRVTDEQLQPINDAFATWQVDGETKYRTAYPQSDGTIRVNGIPVHGTVSKLTVTHAGYIPQTRHNLKSTNDIQQFVLTKDYAFK